MGEFFLIGGVVCLPFQAFVSRERLVLLRFAVEAVVDALQRLGDGGRFQEFAHPRKRRDTIIESLGAGLKDGKARRAGLVFP